MELPVLIICSQTVGGLQEVKRGFENGEIFEALKKGGVSFRQEELVFSN